MCGIAGLLRLDGGPASPVVLRRMTEAIAHRGPDGEGFFTDGPVGLGHRRLAIIDLSPAGHQPMQTGDGRWTLSYNGEIYNFQELRLELEARGFQFRSRTDSEVVLHALAAWGIDALARFNGMFALAAWDRKERRLLLARDRYGIKPLYLARDGHALRFASEIKAILADPGARAAIDPEALIEYLTFQNFFTARTLFSGITLLPAGTWLTITPEGQEASGRYWDFAFAEPAAPRADEAYAEELDRLFRQAVSRQLVADVDIGAYLSGGIDSGSIAALAAQQIDGLKSFTVGFDLNSASGLELGFDERNAAEYMSYLFGTEHYEMVLKAGDMERCMRRLVWHMEEPRVGQSYPNYYASRLASRFVRVVLSGTGGDELFGGYPWRYFRARGHKTFEGYIDSYYAYWQRLLPNGELPRVLAPIWRDVAHVDTRAIFRDVFAHPAADLSRPEDYVNHSLYFEAKTFLHGLLVMEDKLSMAHGLEARVPFLDNDLVALAQQVPVRLKLGTLDPVERIDENAPGSKREQYFRRTKDGKLLLRRVLARYVPDRIAEATKQGFSAPDASWFRGESIEYVRGRLLSTSAAIWGLLDRSAVTALIDDHLSGRQNRRLLIWSLLYLEEWLRLLAEPRAGERWSQP